MIDYIVAENKYGKYCVPKSSQHRPAAQRILVGEVHEPQTIQYILDNAGDGDVIHAGAYFGDMLPALGRIKGALLTFEPTPNYFYAMQTIYLNRLDVAIFPFALDMVSGNQVHVETFSDGDLGGGSRIVPLSSNNTFCVETIHLDIYSQNEISIIHLDIEGCEERTLLGAMRILIEQRPILILETVPEFIFSLGYEIVDKFEGNTVLKV